MTPWSRILALLADARSDQTACEHTYSVRPLPTQGHGWIGCNSTCGAAFLLRTPRTNVRHQPISLPALRVRHGVRVLVDDGIVRSEQTVSLLECLSEEAATVELFVRCVGMAVVDQESLSADTVSALVSTLLELFREFAHASPTAALGLWGELLLIARSLDPPSMVRHWRYSAMSTYDFGSHSECLDVKTTTFSLRHHELSFAQASPPAGLTVAFASIMTERVSSGTSIRALWDRVLQLAPSEQAKIDSACLQTLGRDWAQVQHMTFDLQRALATLRVYASFSVPRLETLPPGVLRARFVADFDRGTPWQGAPPSANGPIALAVSCAASRH